MTYDYGFIGGSIPELEDPSSIMYQSGSCVPIMAWSNEIVELPDSSALSELSGPGQLCAEFANSTDHCRDSIPFLKPPHPLTLRTPSTTASFRSYGNVAQKSSPNASSRRSSLMTTPNSSLGARSIFSPVQQTPVSADTISPDERFVESYDQTVVRWSFDPENTMDQFPLCTEVRDLPLSYNELGLPTTFDESPKFEQTQTLLYLPDTMLPPSLQLSQAIPQVMARPKPKQDFSAIKCEHCDQEFTGRYAKGNMRRHVFHKHGHRVGKHYKCRGCEKRYSRIDARHTHEDTFHPDLRLPATSI